MLIRLAQVKIDVGDTGLPQVNATSTSVSSILKLVFGLIGAITVLVVAYGAFKYVISQGDPQSTAKAKDTIMYALIGLLVSISAYVIIGFVVTRV